MAKTTTTSRTFKIVDLIRARDEFEYIQVPKYPVEVTIEVTTSAMVMTPKPAPSSVFDRLEKEARGELERYEDIITSELKKIEAKIGKLMEQPGEQAKKEAEQMVSETTATVKKALESAKGAVEDAVEKRLKKEAQTDDLLTEARVKLGFSIGAGVISLSANVAKLVATAGADVTSYLSIAKTLFDLGKELNQQLKGEEKLHKDLKDGVDAFLDLRTSVIEQALKRQNLTDTKSIPKNPKDAIEFITNGVMKAGEEVTKDRSAGQVAKEVLDFVVKGAKAKFDDAESARVAYRNHTTKMRHKVDDVSGKADEFEKAMKSAKTLKLGVEIGAKCMKLKGTVRGLAGNLVAAEGFLDDMESVMKAGGMECDDATIIQKLKRLDVATILDGGKAVEGVASDIYDLVKNVAAAVA
jgi:ElaB/YqjD/DUF883 family membrane-anchored ribosome-binding protein